MSTMTEAPAISTNSATNSKAGTNLEQPGVRTRRPAASKISTEVMTTLLRHTSGVIVQDDTGAVRALARLSEDQADDPQLVVLLDHYAANDYLAEAGGKVAAAARQATSDLQAQGDLL